METSELKCQCNKCKEVFSYSKLSSDIKMRHKSPCCQASYTILDRSLDQFFDKFLYINNDPKYYNY